MMDEELDMRRVDGMYHRSLSWTGFLAAALLASMGMPSCLNAGPVYSIQNLGSLGTGAALVTAINSSGAAVGYVTSNSNQVPVSFSGGTANPLGGSGQANGLNDSGTAVGTSYSSTGSPSVAEWSNGQITNPISGYGTGINNAGEIVGGYQTASGDLHAFTWSNGTLVDLGTLNGGTWSSAYGVNSSGEVAGTSSIVGGAFRAFFSNGSGLVNLGTLGGANSHATAINNAGQVVGNAQTSQGYANAFVWQNGTMTGLGTLGGSQSYASGINDAGAVVGYSWTSGDLATDGFIDLAGVMLDLNSLIPVNSGWSIGAAYGINDLGDILGTGTFNGQSYALELQPLDGASSLATPGILATPEPAALALTGLGLLTLLMLRRAKRKTQNI